MVKQRQTAIRPRPQIRVYELATDPEEVSHLFTPKAFYSEALHKRGVERLSEAGYSILRSQALVAIPQMTQSLALLDSGLVSRAQEIAAMTPGDERKQAEQGFTRLGRATHWEAITRLGVIVEQAVALLTAYKASRSGRKSEIALAFLRHELDSLSILNGKERRKLVYWEGSRIDLRRR